MTATALSATRKPFPWGRLLSYAFLIALAVVYLGPLLMLLNTALKTMPLFMKDATALATELHFQNFVTAWNKANFPRYLLNTLLYTASATGLYILMAVFVAFPLARGYVKHSGALLTLFVIALFLPPALIPQFQLILNLGLYNNPVGYVLLFLVNPIGIVILVNYIKTVPRELDEAAAPSASGTRSLRPPST